MCQVLATASFFFLTTVTPSGTIIDTAFPVQAGILKKIAHQVEAVTVVMSAVKKDGKIVMMS